MEQEDRTQWKEPWMQDAGSTLVSLVKDLLDNHDDSKLARYLGYLLSNVFLVVNSHDSKAKDKCLRKLMAALNAYQVTQDPPDYLCDIPTCGTCYPYKPPNS